MREDTYEDEEGEDAVYPWLINADGRQSWPQPANGRDFTLEELQGFVGGSIEILRVPKQVDPRHKLLMVVNDAGRLRRLEFNHNASLVMGRAIVGDALICFARQVK